MKLMIWLMMLLSWKQPLPNKPQPHNKPPHLGGFFMRLKKVPSPAVLE